MSGARACFLGIDCGTGSTKALLLDAEEGSVVGVAASANELETRPDGTSEQHPLDWIRSLTEAVGAVVAESQGIEIRGIAVSGQQHGLVALDASDRPVRPAKLWNDTTT